MGHVHPHKHCTHTHTHTRKREIIIPIDGPFNQKADSIMLTCRSGVWNISLRETGRLESLYLQRSSYLYQQSLSAGHEPPLRCFPAVCVCMHAHVCVCVCKCVHVHAYVCVSVGMCVRACVWFTVISSEYTGLVVNLLLSITVPNTTFITLPLSVELKENSNIMYILTLITLNPYLH